MEITKLNPTKTALPELKKVAAYARVSMDCERLENSLSNQISYYNELIQSTPGWLYAGVYADNGISGGRADTRPELERMIRDAEEGKIDIILVKNISRLCRNTVDLLETVRHLKEIGVEVRFEKERISSLSQEGEMMLTILASFAQEELISTSKNVKWTHRKGFENGKPQSRFHIFGYRWDGWQLIVEPEEAEIIKEIVRRYLAEESLKEITGWLREKGVKTKEGKYFTRGTLDHMLTNSTYTGELVLQKSYVADPVEHVRKRNYGELPKFVVEDNHEAIIDKETFDRIQELRKKRAEEFWFINNKGRRTCFTSRIKCEHCGCSFYKITVHRPTTEDYIYWRCTTKERGKAADCPTKGVPHPSLVRMTCEALGIDEFDENAVTERIEKIIVQEDDDLRYIFKDGTEKVIPWVYSKKEIGWRKIRDAQNKKNTTDD